MSKLPRWEDVKDHPEDRMLYHKANHDELLADLETLTQQMLSTAETEQQKMAVRLVRLVADGMVKCFEQMYYDVQQGFRHWQPAKWMTTDEVTVELSLADLNCVVEALKHAKQVAEDIMVPVFGGINGDSGEEYTPEEVDQAVEIADDISREINKIINKDKGTIIING